jgi:tetratricopeptide (TPR) repeat protein
MRTKAKGILFRVLAVLAGLAAGALLAEACLRVFRIRPERYPPQQWLAWDGVAFRDTGVWGGGLVKRRSPFADEGVTMGEYVPHAIFRGIFASNPRGYFDHDNSVLATINSLGLRGEEITAEKPAGTYRILGIGDSFAFGEGVKDDDTFLHRLQLRLNAGNAGPTRYQVLNAGVQGYNTRDEVVYLEHHWLALNPDLVLIVFYINDAYDDGAILNRGQELGIYRANPVGLGRYSYLLDLAQYKYHAYQDSRKVEAYYNQHFFSQARSFLENPGDVKVDWTVCRAALERAGQITRQRNIKLGLVMFPELFKLKGGYPFMQVHSLVRDTCSRLGIPFLDLFDTFRGHEPKTLWVHPSNHHPNEIAHAMAAEAIERFVKEQFLAPGPNTIPQEPASGGPPAPAPEHTTTPALRSSTNPALRHLSPPDLPQTRNELISSLVQEGRLDEAQAQLEKALQIQPDDAEAHSNLGNVLHKKGKRDEAIAHYQKALQIQPSFAKAHHNLANVLLEQGRVDDAIAHYQKALALQPDFLAARNNLGLVFLELGRLDEAQAQFKETLDLRPDFAPAQRNLGSVLLQKGQVQEALAHFQKALQLQPDSPQTCERLAWVLATSPEASIRNGAKALALARKAEALSGDDNPLVVRTLAAAYAEAGQFPEAVATAQRALQLALVQSNTELAKHLRAETALYQGHSAYREGSPNAAHD